MRENLPNANKSEFRLIITVELVISTLMFTRFGNWKGLPVPLSLSNRVKNLSAHLCPQWNEDDSLAIHFVC